MAEMLESTVENDDATLDNAVDSDATPEVRS